MLSSNKLAVRFLKLSSELGTPSDQLNRLLTQVLSQEDRDSWLIFLDLLEEQMPKAREFLDISKTTKQVLNTLCKYFDNIMRFDQSNQFIKFNIDNIYNIEYTAWANHKIYGIKYKDYYYEKFRRIPHHIIFNSTTEIDGEDTRTITRMQQGITLSNNGHSFLPHSTKAEEIFNKIAIKADSDIERLERLFAMPSKQIRLASESDVGTKDDQLHRLLATTIKDGDRESWLIFLDLLEEDRPAQAARLRDSKNISGIFEYLNKFFPSLVAYYPGTDDIALQDPHFGNFILFDLKHSSVKYNDFRSGLNSIKINKNNPIYHDRPIFHIIRWGGYFMVSFDQFNYADYDIHEGSEDYDFINEIFKKYRQIALDDLKYIESIFAIPT